MNKHISLVIRYLAMFLMIISSLTKNEASIAQDVMQNYEKVQPKADTVMSLSCKITPSIWYGPTDKPPFYSTNNLRRKVGYAQFASGQCIQIIGRVLDRSCVPIQNILVQIWHADTNGFYKNSAKNTKAYLNDRALYKLPSDQIASNKKVNDVKLDKMFAGSGSAITDNLGYYRFYTIMPGKFDNSPPKVYFNVMYFQKMHLETMMFFPENNNIHELKKITDSELMQESLIAVKLRETEDFYNTSCPIYRFDITMNTNAQYRQY